MSRRTVTAAELRDFARRWPCSGMDGASEPITFVYDAKGDLVDIEGDCSAYDDSAVAVLSAPAGVRS